MKTIFIASPLIAAAAMFTAAPTAHAELSVITTVTDLAAIVQEVGGAEVKVESICRGSQDPHYIEPKPSYMVKASHADLLIAVGLGLEVGWLPSIIQGARNPRIAKGQPGFLEVGSLIEALDVPSGKVSRAEGDVHPEGNPHFMLDPIRVGQVALGIAKRLSELDPVHATQYGTRAAALEHRLSDKTKAWQERVRKSSVSKVITFHQTLRYFFARFHLEAVAILEPLPGVPPTAKHILEVIGKAKAEKVQLILVENFFDPAVAERVAKDVAGLRIAVVPVAVGGDAAVQTIDEVYETLVRAIEGTKSHG